ncbi:MAG: XRE family transcriptional regulator [Candidatus Izemoplasmatales bacterium]
MITEILKTMIHLDNIRIKKNITVEKLCEGICGDRQYRKYLSGENNISEKRLMEFVNRLGLSQRDFYFSLSEKDAYETRKLIDLYKQIEHHQFDNFIDNADKISKLTSLSLFNERLLTYCKTRYHRIHKEIYDQAAYDQYSKLCNYPECINNNAFDFIDIISILEISDIEEKIDRTGAMELLLRILDDKSVKYLTSDISYILPAIYTNLSITLGSKHQDDEAIKIANTGVRICLKNGLSQGLGKLYYVLSICYKRRGEFKKAKHYATLCFAEVISKNNAKNTEFFFNTLFEDFNFDPFDLFKEYKEILLTENI